MMTRAEPLLCFSLPEQRAAMVAAVFGKTGQALSERQQLLELGEAAIRYFTEIMHRRSAAMVRGCRSGAADSAESRARKRAGQWKKV
jgi:hypothetical protein